MHEEEAAVLEESSSQQADYKRGQRFKKLNRMINGPVVGWLGLNLRE